MVKTYLCLLLLSIINLLFKSKIFVMEEIYRKILYQAISKYLKKYIYKIQIITDNYKSYKKNKYISFLKGHNYKKSEILII